MADSKAQSLVKRTIDSLTSITGVRLWSGKTGDPTETAQGIDLPDLLSSSPVGAASTINYKALTPQGFANSVATEDVKGIVELATSDEVVAETANKTLQADDQAKMRQTWARGSDTSNLLGRAKVWQEDGLGEDSADPLSYKFAICFHTNRADAVNKLYYPIPFTIPTSKRIVQITVNGIFYTTSSYGKVDNEYYSVYGGDAEIQMGVGFKLVIPLDGSAPYISSSIIGMQSCALDVLAIVR